MQADGESKKLFLMLCVGVATLTDGALTTQTYVVSLFCFSECHLSNTLWHFQTVDSRIEWNNLCCCTCIRKLWVLHTNFAGIKYE